jgi:dipeptidyl aminopeptidase/acylaminoacyl peptidase
MRVHALIVTLSFLTAPCPALLGGGTPPSPPPDPTEAIEASVTALMKVQSATSPSFSPDGKRIAFVSTASGEPQAWTVPAEGGTPVRLVTTAGPVTTVEWSPDGRRIAYAVAPGTGMNTQVWLVAPDGSGAKRITDGGTEMNGLGPFRADGKVLALASNRRFRTYVDAWLYDLASGKLALAAENRGLGAVEDISPDGKMVLLERSPTRESSDLYLVDVGTKKERRLTLHEGPARFQGRLAPDGKSVYVATNAGREMTAFGRIDLAAGTPGIPEILASRDDAEISSFLLDDAGTRAVLLWNVAGRSELAFYDLKKKTLAAGPPLPGDVVSGMSLSKDGTKLALALSGPALPSDIWVLEIGSGRFSQVTRSAHAGVDLAALVKPRAVTITTYDGKPLSGWLYRAKREGASPGPFVLSFHGGPEAEERPTFRPDYQALLERGISIFAPNVRGSSGFGRTFLGLDDQGKRINVLRDVKSCRDWAIEQKIADPSRVGIMGHAYGGWVAVAALTLYSDDFAAGADVSGIVDFPAFFDGTEAWLAEISKAEYGDPAKQAQLLRSLSPLFKVNLLKAPLLVIHGKNDTVVPIAQANRLVDALKSRNVPVEFVLLHDEGHDFRRLENRISANVALVRWFAEYLHAAPTK